MDHAYSPGFAGAIPHPARTYTPPEDDYGSEEACEETRRKTR